MSGERQYTVWIDRGIDGWQPVDCFNEDEIINAIADSGVTVGRIRITSPVQWFLRIGGEQ